MKVAPKSKRWQKNCAAKKSKGRVAKYEKPTIESVGAIINRPRAVNDRPYIHKM